MTAPNATPHPSWCVPTRSCRFDETRRHITNPRVIDDPTNNTVITGRMWTSERRIDGSWVTYLDLAITVDGEELAVVTLPAQQVRALRDWLTSVVLDVHWEGKGKRGGAS